jgi:hypothetical protein
VVPATAESPLVGKQEAASTQQLTSSLPKPRSEPGHPDEHTPEVDDPLQGMTDKDRFGLKGLLALLKSPHADQAALAQGLNIDSLGLDIHSAE